MAAVQFKRLEIVAGGAEGFRNLGPADKVLRIQGGAEVARLTLSGNAETDAGPEQWAELFAASPSLLHAFRKLRQAVFSAQHDARSDRQRDYFQALLDETRPLSERFPRQHETGRLHEGVAMEIVDPSPEHEEAIVADAKP
jgi:hypothetical protein